MSKPKSGERMKKIIRDTFDHIKWTYIDGLFDFQKDKREFY